MYKFYLVQLNTDLVYSLLVYRHQSFQGMGDRKQVVKLQISDKSKYCDMENEL